MSCMLLTCSTSYCLVTASGIYGMHICMYVCVCVCTDFLNIPSFTTQVQEVPYLALNETRTGNTVSLTRQMQKYNIVPFRRELQEVVY